MRPEALQEAADWLRHARRDLAVVQPALEATVPLRDIAAYHCQQAAEKALKGFLAAHDIAFPQTHDLERLVGMCCQVESSFDRFEQAARVLNPMATLYRYPGPTFEPSESQMQTALHHASDIVDFTSGLLGIAPTL